MSTTASIYHRNVSPHGNFGLEDDLFLETALENRESILRLSQQKLHSPKCSMRCSLLIQTALPLLSATTTPVSLNGRDIVDDEDEDEMFEEEMENESKQSSRYLGFEEDEEDEDVYASSGMDDEADILEQGGEGGFPEGGEGNDEDCDDEESAFIFERTDSEFNFDEFENDEDEVEGRNDADEFCLFPGFLQMPATPSSIAANVNIEALGESEVHKASNNSMESSEQETEASSSVAFDMPIEIVNTSHNHHHHHYQPLQEQESQHQHENNQHKSEFSGMEMHSSNNVIISTENGFLFDPEESSLSDGTKSLFSHASETMFLSSSTSPTCIERHIHDVSNSEPYDDDDAASFDSTSSASSSLEDDEHNFDDGRIFGEYHNTSSSHSSINTTQPITTTTTSEVTTDVTIPTCCDNNNSKDYFFKNNSSPTLTINQNSMVVDVRQKSAKRNFSASYSIKQPFDLGGLISSVNEAKAEYDVGFSNDYLDNGEPALKTSRPSSPSCAFDDYSSPPSSPLLVVTQRVRTLG